MKTIIVLSVLALNTALASPYDQYVCKEADTDAYVVIDRHDTINNDVSVIFGRFNIISAYTRGFKRTDLSTYPDYKFAYTMTSAEMTADVFLAFNPFFEGQSGELVLRLTGKKGEELTKKFTCELHEFIR